MTVFEMLPEVIGPEELFALVAFTKLVDGGKMIATNHPILCWKVRKLFTTVSAHIEFCRHARLLWWSVVGICVRGNRIARMKGSLVVVVQGSTRPRVPPKVERVLMAFGLVLVFEAVLAPMADVLLLVLMLSI